MVLVRTPGLSSKFDDAWAGPYEVLRKVTNVTWEIAVPDSKLKKKRIVHSNLLKVWHTADARIGRIMLATDDDSLELQPPIPTKTLSDSQLSQLAQIYSDFDFLLSGKL